MIRTDKNVKILFGKIFILSSLFITILLLSNTNSTIITNEPEPIFNVVLDEGSFIINEEEITLFLYHNGNRYNLNAPNPSQGGLPPGLRNQINFDTDLIEEETGRFRYNHTFSTVATNFVTKVGYVFPVDCSFVSPVLHCGFYEFDFTEAINNQGLSINYLNNELTIEGDDLSYIDPIIQSTGSPDLTQSSSSEAIVRNSSDSFFVLYSNDSTTMVAISDNSGTTWRHSYTGLNCDFDTSGHFGTLLINSTEALHVICSDGTATDIVYSIDSGSTWSTSAEIHANNADHSLDAAIGPSDEMILCISILNDNQIYNSSTSGISWTRTDEAYIGRGCAVEIDSTGMHHLATASVSDGDNVRYYNTTDPTSWTNEITVNDGISMSINDVELALDPVDDEVFILTIRDGTASDFAFYNSTNNQDFTETFIDISDTSMVFLDMAVVNNSEIHVIGTETFSSNDADVRYANSFNGGLVWSSATSLLSQVDFDLRRIHLRGSRYPFFNNITSEGTLDFIYENNSISGLEIHFSNRTTNINPRVNITFPSNNSNHTGLTLNVNYTATDSESIDACWYSNDTFAGNITLTDCANITTVTWTEGQHNVTVYANDTRGAEGSDSVMFSIDLTGPTVTLDYPPNNTFFNTTRDIYLNYTATDPNGIANCSIYHNLTGTFHLNQTNTGVTSGQQNFTTVNGSSDGEYIWNVECTDTTNSANFSENNLTFTIDTTLPLIDSISVSTTQGSQTVTFNFSITETNPEVCIYRVDTEAGVEEIANTTLDSCFENDTQAVVAAFQTYNLTLYVNDSATNSNSSTQQFTTVESGATGGGGGGGSASTSQIPFIGLQETNTSVVYNDLERGIIYATINNFCAEKITDEPFAIEDLSSNCQLTVNDLVPIIERLSTFNLEVNIEDLRLFIENYKNKLFFQGSTSRANVDRFNLFVSQLGLVTLLQLNPPSVDKIVSLYEPEGRNRTIPITVTSNKPLKSCQVISETPALTCIIEEENIIKIEYFIEKTQFVSRIFSGTLLIQTDAPLDEIEEKRLTVSIRVINLGWKKVAIIVGGSLVSVIIAVFVISTRRSKKKISKQFKDLVSLK